MKRPKPKEDLIDVICPACNGTGFPTVRQAVQPGRKIYSASCKRCFGKGRISEVICPACNGTGFPTVMQPVQPGRKIFPGPCKRCSGEGRIGSPAKGVPFSFFRMNFRKKPKPKVVSQEVQCAACDGTGFPLVILQPIKPGHKIYPAPCKECAGKGRIASAGAPFTPIEWPR
jgi:DnaJ-class molecular chaperone